MSKMIEFNEARKVVMDILAGKINTVTAVKVAGALEEMAVEAEPVVHARWLNAVDEDPELFGWVPLDTVLCSHCRKLDKENRRKTQRCPICGAKMDLV